MIEETFYLQSCDISPNEALISIVDYFGKVHIFQLLDLTEKENQGKKDLLNVDYFPFVFSF